MTTTQTRPAYMIPYCVVSVGCHSTDSFNPEPMTVFVRVTATVYVGVVVYKVVFYLMYELDVITSALHMWRLRLRKLSKFPRATRNWDLKFRLSDAELEFLPLML